MEKKILSIIVLIIFTGCSSNKKTLNYNVIEHQKYGISDLFVCYVNDTSSNELYKIGHELSKETQVAFILFYNDSTKIKSIKGHNNLLDAIPYDGYFAKYDKTPSGNFSLERKNKIDVIPNNVNGPIKIMQLDYKVRKGKYRWYTYFVENYVDTKETERKMIEIAKELPVDETGFTEVFFFNHKEEAPELAADGGWGNDESQSSWNRKYGKYCVGYYSADSKEQIFLKQWD